MHIPVLKGVQNERMSKHKNTNYRNFFKQLQIASSEISLKNYFFFLAYVFFLYISKIQVLKSR